MRSQIKKRSNLRDVANRSGVSVATVSRVLNTPNKVTTETRNRVEQAIADLKFVPSAAARAMNRGNSGIVAALLPTLDNAIYARVVNGLETRFRNDDLSLIVAQTGDAPDAELARARKMIDIGAEALVVVGVTHDAGLYELIERTQRPVVAISYYDESSSIPTVGYDNWEAASVAARHFADLGHRHVGVLHGPVAGNDRTQRRLNALDAQDFGIEFTFFEVEVSMAGGLDGIDWLQAGHPEITGALCFSDVIAHGALHRLNALQLRVPEEFSIMGIENLPGSEYTYPQLTSVRLNVERMGELSADAIISWLRTETRPASASLPVELVPRGSTAPIPSEPFA
ncbi:MAG: LacI family DNA-binding transcriptional regulator [Paracoccaceae bacterium]|nr:LacI family DNA-binding transcriptional regulator [Paracoccaceae bacterium]